MYADLPSELDIYAVMNDMSNREELSTDSGADLTTMEKAFIAQQIAMKNELEKSFKDDIVSRKQHHLNDFLKHVCFCIVLVLIQLIFFTFHFSPCVIMYLSCCFFFHCRLISLGFF